MLSSRPSRSTRAELAIPNVFDDLFKESAMPNLTNSEKTLDVMTWPREAHNWAWLNEGPFVLVAYLKPVESSDARSIAITWTFPSRQELDAAYQDFVGTDRYHFLAAFDKTSAEWETHCPAYEEGLSQRPSGDKG